MVTYEICNFGDPHLDSPNRRIYLLYIVLLLLPTLFVQEVMSFTVDRGDNKSFGFAIAVSCYPLTYIINDVILRTHSPETLRA